MKENEPKPCSEHDCPFAKTHASKCWKCDRHRTTIWNWQTALFITYAAAIILCINLTVCYPWSILGEPFNPKPVPAIYFTLLWVTFGVFLAAFTALVVTVHKAKSEYLENGKRKPFPGLCDNPRCHYDLNKANCPECGRVSSPFSKVWLWFLLSINAPLAVAGSCIQGSYLKSEAVPIIGNLVFLFGAAVLVWLVIDFARRQK